MEIRRRQGDRRNVLAYDLVASPAEDERPHGRRRFEVRVPEAVGAQRPHPDVEALALLLVVARCAIDEVTVPSPVSLPFATAVEKQLGLALRPVDEALEVRRPPTGGRPGLAFSAGVDSTAVLAVLPESTVSYFLERVTPPKSPRSQLTTEAALQACHDLERMGRTVRVLGSDLEFVPPKPGFPEHFANAVPALLCSDLDGLDAISWGVIAESAYRLGKYRFEQFLGRRVNARWYALFAAVGLPMLNPLLGVSEIGSTTIARESPYGHLASSCVRGGSEGPCQRCWKCFRKGVLDAALTDRWPDRPVLNQLMHSHSVRAALAQVPIKHEIGLTWALARYDGSHELLNLLARRVRAGEEDVSFLEGWYPPSSETWPDHYRTAIEAELGDRWPRQTRSQQAAMEAFSVEDRVADPAERGFAAAVSLMIDHHAARYGDAPVKATAPFDPDVLAVGGVVDPPHGDLQSAAREIQRLRRQVTLLEHSTSYRLGRRLVDLAGPAAPLIARARSRGGPSS